MNASYEIININEPLESVSYNEENGYYVDPVDAKKLIENYLQEVEYDHIFIVVKLGDVLHTDEVGDWIGLRWNEILWTWIFKY